MMPDRFSAERAAREAGFDDYDVPKLYVPKLWHILGSGFLLLGAGALIVWIVVAWVMTNG